MTIRLNRRIKIFPGFYLHIGKCGIGASIGTRGAHVGVSTCGRPYASVGIPGTGIYVRHDAQQRLADSEHLKRLGYWRGGAR